MKSVEASVDKKTVLEVLVGQKQITKTVLSSLLALQDEFGYIADDAIEAVANFCNSSINDVWSVASYYTNFRFSPLGANLLEVCWGPTCHLMGAQSILRKLHSVLGINGEGETSDNSISLRYNTCLGACANAPVVAVNHHLSGRNTPEKVAQLAASLMADATNTKTNST